MVLMASASAQGHASAQGQVLLFDVPLTSPTQAKAQKSYSA
jgi:hypothetical protein